MPGHSKKSGSGKRKLDLDSGLSSVSSSTAAVKRPKTTNFSSQTDELPVAKGVFTIEAIQEQETALFAEGLLVDLRLSSIDATTKKSTAHSMSGGH